MVSAGPFPVWQNRERRRRAAIAAALVVLSVLLGNATAGWCSSNEIAKSAFEQKDYATALRIWRELADRGDIDAQVGVAIIYADGWV